MIKFNIAVALTGILRFMVGPIVGEVKVMGVGATGCCTGCCASCLEVLILCWGPLRLGCSSLLLVSSSLVSVSYLLLLGATILDAILNAVVLNSLLVGPN